MILKLLLESLLEWLATEKSVKSGLSCFLRQTIFPVSGRKATFIWGHENLIRIMSDWIQTTSKSFKFAILSSHKHLFQVVFANKCSSQVFFL